MHNYHNPYVSHWYNNTRYRTKWGAAQAALSDGVPVYFIFDKIKITLGDKPEFFGDLDTTVEPEGTWEELLRERAQYLRDTLPSINIYYSGGHDSWLILETFLKNNIKIDRLIIERYIPNIDKKLNYEQNNVALESLKHLNLGTTEVIVADFDDIPLWEQTMSNMKSYFEDGFELSAGFAATYQNRNDSAFLYCKGEPTIRGTTYPRIYLQDGKYRSNMWDSDNWLGAHVAPLTIPFFTDSHYPKLHLKQLHLTKNYFKLHNLYKISEDSHKHEYKEAYLNACRYTSPSYMYNSPYHIKRSDKYNTPVDQKVSLHLTKKKVRFLNLIYKNDKKLFDTYQSVTLATLGGTAMITLPSFLRIYDVPLE